MTQHPRAHPLALAVASLLAAPAVHAAAVTDGSLGAVQTLQGQFVVPQSLGTLRGSNLLHSFGRFSIASGESATFTTSSAGVLNIVARVSGTDASTLAGPLRVQGTGGSAASFWLFNPNGIAVTAGASFDVPAGLHLSTSPQLKLSDGSSWDLRQPPPGTLAVAAPESFGLLGRPAPLAWRDTSLQLPAGARLELAGGDLLLQRSTLSVVGAPAQLRAAGTVLVSDSAAVLATADAGQAGPALQLQAAALTLDGGGLADTGLATLARRGSAGDTGGIDIQVSGPLQVSRGASIYAVNTSDQAAAPLRLSAGSLHIDGNAVTTFVGSVARGAGAGGDVTVRVDGDAQVLAGGQLQAVTLAAGASGSLTLAAQTLTVDGRQFGADVGTVAVRGLQGGSGAVNVHVAGAVTVRDGGTLQSQSATAAGSGDLTLSAGSLQLSGGSYALPTNIGSAGYAGSTGRVTIRVDGTATLRNGADITSASDGSGDAAPMSVSVGRLDVEGLGSGGKPASVSALSFGSGAVAPLDISASDSIRVGPRGQLASAAGGSGRGSPMRVRAPRIVVEGDTGGVTAITSDALDAASLRGGDLQLEAGSLSITGSALVSTTSLGTNGRAGDLLVNVGELTIDGGGAAAGLRSLGWGAFAQPGDMVVNVRQGLSVRNGGALMVTTLGRGRPGSLTVNAGSVLIDGSGSPDTATGIGGDSVEIEGQVVAGAASPVNVTAQRIDIRPNGTISSSTSTDVDAGAVRVVADTLRIDGGGNAGKLTGIGSDSTSGHGNAGSVSVQARQIDLLAEGQISSLAVDGSGRLDGPARGGQVQVRADTLTLTGTSGIYSLAGTAGGAGSVDVAVTGALTLTGGAGIVANTGGVGPAGTVTVRSGSLTMSGVDAATALRSRIGSRATEGSGGQPGTVDITVTGATELSDGAALTVANNARVSDAAALRPSQLTLRSGSLLMTDAEITAAATVNANAGNLVVSTGGDLKLVRSVVRTSAVDGDGGSIAVSAGGTATLRDARITTSVDGQRNGNGGDIAVTAAALVLQSSLVQANTAAALARGGRITIDTGVLLPDGSRVAVGGNRIEDFSPGVPGRNVIQAAAPDGVGGTLAVTLPQLDLAASLVNLITPRIDGVGLQRNLCEADGDSRLAIQGRGGLWPTAAGPVSVQP